MVGHRFAAVLVLVPVFVNVGRTIGSAAASTVGIVTRELSRGITETMRPLPNEEQAPVQVRVGKRGSVNLTGANCASTCSGVAGTGPNQVDCHQMIDALNAQGTATFTMEPYSVASWVQASCTIEFLQSTADTVTYTYIYLGSVATYLSGACNEANGYADGRCIFDGRENAIWIGNTAVSGQSM